MSVAAVTLSASLSAHPAAPPASGRAPAENTAVAALTRRLAAGDEAAFREFHTQYFHRLYRFLLVVSRGEMHTAQDALQETFVRVAKHAREFATEEIFWSWLKAVARNVARDGGRRHSRYLAFLNRFRSVTPEAGAERDEWRGWLADALTTLDAADRRLVEGKYLEQKTVAELASETGLSIKAIEARLSRSRRELAATLLHSLRKP